MRKTTLRPEQNGHYRRNLGYVRREDGKLVQPKFGLGKVKRIAQDRLDRITAIWQRVERKASSDEEVSQPTWDSLSLSIARAIARGKSMFRLPSSPHDAPHPAVYSRAVEMAAQEYPEIQILPEDEEMYREGNEDYAKRIQLIEDHEKSMLEMADDLRTTVLATPGNERKYVDLLGSTTLFQALDAYVQYIEGEYFDRSEDAINDTGMTKISMVRQIKTYIEDMPLDRLADYSLVDGVFAIFRSRPKTHRYDRPMSSGHASKLIGELNQFFKWLHTQPEWDWRKPPDYHEIKRRPIEFDEDADIEAKEVPTYTVAQIKILFEYATPLERLLILLAINCAYGADQIGRLRIGEIIQKKGVYYIRRIRRKKKVTGMHRLFAITREGIQWAIQGREHDKKAHVLINGNGNPLWRKTKGGHRSKDIPNAWYRLLDRITQDHPKYPRHGFSTLRDTSANFVRRIGGEEVASSHLTHRHQSSDKNLRRYTNVNRKKLFRAHRILERRLVDAFAIDENPWQERNNQNVTQGQIKQIRSLAKNGTPVTEIVRELGLSRTTVYRWVGDSRSEANRK